MIRRSLAAALVASTALCTPAFAFTSGDITSYSDNTGAHVKSATDGTTTRVLNPSTSAITATGPLLLSINNNASNSAASIYQMVFGSPVTTYDMVQGVAVQPTGSTVLATNALAGYLLNQNASIGMGSNQNAVGLFGVAIGAASSAATWGGNVIVTDNTAQSASSFHNQNLTGFEIDVNAWDTTSVVNGLTIAGASGQQPTQANAVLVGRMDITGANRAKWTTGFEAGSGCCTIGALIGTTLLSGNSLPSMPLDFFVTNSSGVIKTYNFTANPTFFGFSSSFGAAGIWAFDASISMPASTAITMNSDNVLSADGSHNLLLGNAGTVSTITIGNTTAAVTITGGVLAPQLPTQAHAGSNACIGYNASTKALYVSSTITTC